jgi:hypothetical protein
MLNKKQKNILDKSTAKKWSDLSSDIWIELNTNNQSSDLSNEIDEYLGKRKEGFRKNSY